MKDKKQNNDDKKKEESLMGIFEHPLKFPEFDEILEREIKSFGRSSHVILPQKHAGKKARITIYKNKSEKEENQR